MSEPVEPQPEPQPESQPESQLESPLESQIESQPESQPEPEPESQPEPQPESEPESQSKFLNIDDDTDSCASTIDEKCELVTSVAPQAAEEAPKQKQKQKQKQPGLLWWHWRFATDRHLITAAGEVPRSPPLPTVEEEEPHPEATTRAPAARRGTTQARWKRFMRGALKRAGIAGRIMHFSQWNHNGQRNEWILLDSAFLAPKPERR